MPTIKVFLFIILCGIGANAQIVTQPIDLIGSDEQNHLLHADSIKEHMLFGEWDQDSLLKEFPTGYLLYDESKSTRAIKLGLDSIILTYPNSSASSTKNEYAYDEYGNNVLGVQYTKVSNGNEWIPWSKYVFDYDVKGNLLERSFYHWSLMNNDWKGIEKHVYEYDQSGNITKRIYYQWKDSNSQWVRVSESYSEYNVNNLLTQNITNYWNDNSLAYYFGYKQNIFYDSQDNDTLSLVIRWDTVSNEWVNLFRSIKKMNSDNLLIEEASYQWNSTFESWGGDGMDNRYTYAYYVNGKMLNRIMYVWDNSNQQWKKYIKYEFKHDVNLFRSEQIKLRWNSTNLQWDQFNKLEWDRDVNGNVLLYSGYLWDVNYWRKIDEVEKVYDINNNVTSEVVQTYTPAVNQLENWYKYYRTFDSNGNMTVKELWHWNYFTDQWFRYQRNEYTFDVNEDEMLQIQMGTDSLKTQWVNQYKVETFYDSQHHMIAIQQDVWDTSSSGGWNPEYLREYVYDTAYGLSDLIVPEIYDYNGKLSYWKQYALDSLTSNWVVNREERYFFTSYIIDSMEEIENNEISIYPNPVEEYFIIDCDNPSEIGLLKLFDQSGRMVFSKQVASSHKVNINQLSSGSYIYSIQLSGINYSGILIKK